MKKIEYELLGRCPACGIILLEGPPIQDWEQRIQKLGLKKVCLFESDADLSSYDGVYSGDVIGKGITFCPRCGGSPFVAVEVDHADTCALCDRSVSSPWFRVKNRCVGLCDPCHKSSMGKAWLDSLYDEE